MAAQPVTIQGGNYMQRDLQVSEDADFNWPLSLYDGEPPNETAAVLTGRTFKFEVFGIDGKFIIMGNQRELCFIA